MSGGQTPPAQQAAQQVARPLAEAETEVLLAWLTNRSGQPTSSDIARTELLRVVRRVAPDRLEGARRVLDAVTLIKLAAETVEEAGRLAPATMRSLDAVHLAAVLRLGDDLDAVVTYDDRLAEAARLNGASAVGPA